MGPLLGVSRGWTSLARTASRPLPATQIRGLPGEGTAGSPGAEERGQLGPSANPGGRRAGLSCLSRLYGCFLKLESVSLEKSRAWWGADGPSGAEDLDELWV